MIISNLCETRITWRGEIALARLQKVSRPYGLIVGEQQQRKRQTSENKSIKTNGVTFYFSNMSDEILHKRERIVNSFSNIPQPFFVGNMVIVQPSERELYLKQIEP